MAPSAVDELSTSYHPSPAYFDDVAPHLLAAAARGRRQRVCIAAAIASTPICRAATIGFRGRQS
jgi:hypothetical protein